MKKMELQDFLDNCYSKIFPFSNSFILHETSHPETCIITSFKCLKHPKMVDLLKKFVTKYWVGKDAYGFEKLNVEIEN